MTVLADPPAEPALDVRAFLLGDAGPAALRDGLREALAQHPPDGLARLGRSARGLLDEQLADAAAGLLDVDLGATAVAGWRRHQQLVQAARETRDAPGLTLLVDLAAHRTTSTWRPRVELVVAGGAAAHVTFELSVTLEVVGLMAAVAGGRLTRLGGGRGTLTARLAVGGQVLAERSAPFDAHRSVRLGDGVPLLTAPRPEETPAVVEPGAAAGAPA